MTKGNGQGVKARLTPEDHKIFALYLRKLIVNRDLKSLRGHKLDL